MYETTDYAGIDYSMGSANFDPITGIRFGVIPAHEVGAAWYDSSEPKYSPPTCPECGSENLDESEEEVWGNLKCKDCNAVFPEWELYGESLESWEVDEHDVTAFQSGDDNDIFVIKSIYFTYAQFCSPCAPGACYLLNPISEEIRSERNKCYCFGHDWFENGVAPYPVFSVETGEEILP